MGNNLFPTILKHRSDFQKLSKQGQRVFPGSWMIVNYDHNECGETRYGWTISKFVGNAVARNRFKRWCREYIRQRSDMMVEARLDVNFVFRRKSKEFYKELSHEEFDTCLDSAFKTLKRKSKKYD